MRICLLWCGDAPGVENTRDCQSPWDLFQFMVEVTQAGGSIYWVDYTNNMILRSLATYGRDSWMGSVPFEYAGNWTDLEHMELVAVAAWERACELEEVPT